MSGRTSDQVWVEKRAGAWLSTFFHHDFVLLFDKSDRPVYSRLSHLHAPNSSLLDIRSPELTEVLDTMRGRDGVKSNAILLTDRAPGESGALPP